ncbi:MAG TPA: thioesterase family protein [Acidimicrobiales bacterium]|nr:thioesterase family protein [Acidimicrobiales bacterium]
MRAVYEPPTDARAYQFCHRVRVRFAETDAMGVVHHAAYLPYLEETRVEFLRSLGHPFDLIREDGFELPVTEVVVHYLRPLVFDDEVDVHLTVANARGATFQLGYLLTVDRSPRATASTVHAVIGPNGRPTRCPDWLVSLAPARPTRPTPATSAAGTGGSPAT